MIKKSLLFSKLVVLFLLSFYCFAGNDSQNLTQQLNEKHNASKKKRPAEITKLFDKANNEVKALGLHKQRPNVGDKFIDHEFVQTLSGKKTKLSELWSKGALIVKFYRGHWCPYCQIELKSYQENIEKFHELWAQIIVFTPDVKKYVNKVKERFSITFPIYTDENNEFGKKLGIVFHLNEDVNAVYKKFDIDLKDSQENSMQELPLPATYVVDRNGIVIYKYADADYTLRADPIDVLNAIKKKMKKD